MANKKFYEATYLYSISFPGTLVSLGAVGESDAKSIEAFLDSVFAEWENLFIDRWNDYYIHMHPSNNYNILQDTSCITLKTIYKLAKDIDGLVFGIRCEYLFFLVAELVIDWEKYLFNEWLEEMGENPIDFQALDKMVYYY